jgi:predicted GIY-YIG superfamily endonuclease
MLFLKRRVISNIYIFFLKKKRAAINMHKKIKKINKQTNISLIYYSQEWPFLNKAIIFIMDYVYCIYNLVSMNVHD